MTIIPVIFIDSYVTIINSVFIGNYAGYLGGSIACQTGHVNVIGSTFIGNSAALGGAVVSGGNVFIRLIIYAE